MATISFGDYNEKKEYSPQAVSLVKTIEAVLNESRNNAFLTRLSEKLFPKGETVGAMEKYGLSVATLASFHPIHAERAVVDDPYNTCAALFKIYNAAEQERTAWQTNARTAARPLLNNAELTQFRQILDGMNLAIQKPECGCPLAASIIEKYNSDVVTGRIM